MWPTRCGTNGNDPVEFVPRAGMGEGDIIGVPVRVCDDGRWNGKCYHNGDGAPGHLTRADCSECGYGTASLQVINNTTGPTVQLTDPPAAPAKGRISVIGAPDDNDFVDVTNTDGDTTRVVIDRDTDVTTVTRPTTVAVVNQSPLDGDTFKLRDHTGNERRYVFRPGSERVDGSTSDLNGIPHIQVGTSGAGGTAGVAERLATAVTNTGALDISAVADGNRVHSHRTARRIPETPRWNRVALTPSLSVPSSVDSRSVSVRYRTTRTRWHSGLHRPSTTTSVV